MKFDLVEFSLLRGDPTNPRVTYRKIEELAETIRLYGVLQNLVVEPQGDFFIVKAGERRRRALEFLAERGNELPLIPCLILEPGEGTFEALVENTCRDPVPVWRLGFRYHEFRDAGMTQLEIATRVGKNIGHVSIAMKIAEGLHPAIIKRLDHLGPEVISTHKLNQMASLISTTTGEPDEKAQAEMLDAQLGKKQRKALPKRNQIPIRERVYLRFCKLQKGIHAPAHALPVINALMRYLSGKDDKFKIPFREP